MTEIRKALPQDRDEIWQIIREVISKGDTYTFEPATSKEFMLDYWYHQGTHTYVLTDDGKVSGTFIIRANQPGLGLHVDNASYMVAENASGKVMGEYSLKEAKRLGYKAMQFNIVVKSNTRAINLWQKLGFKIIGEIPDAFNHIKNGFTNAYIMYRSL